MILNSVPLANQNPGAIMSALTEGSTAAPNAVRRSYHQSPLSFIQFLLSLLENRAINIQPELQKRYITDRKGENDNIKFHQYMPAQRSQETKLISPRDYICLLQTKYSINKRITTLYSDLSLNGQFLKDTSLGTPRVGPCLPALLYFS